ncbi:DUF2309 domain-containing protein [Oceanimonas sp. CHS3-5]|uniref:YbcC family protein n=1 Tax=Oceanimonas sp. CHS3-5 TaxID=3068186 RepID=UPI00273EB8AF|nr:DUF2309 domain-containing protein [Oceanimonas sp. CHS3-5]MDP5292079.1 DUF2309 domain-containing protein [Oceanimonas sp. CHS3-5]
MSASRQPHDHGGMVDAAIHAACAQIAPTWPLDRMIAVNPYWSMVERPFAEVAEQQARLAGSPMAMPLDYYRTLWQDGRITPADLDAAAGEAGEDATAAIAALEHAATAPVPPPLLCDTLDSQRDLQHHPAWCDTITHQIAQFCAAYFDEDQADWHPERHDGLYQSWRATLMRDHSVALLMQAANMPARAAALAATPREQIHQALAQLGIEPDALADYLQAVIYRIGGWAAWCAYRRWQARLNGQDDDTLVDLLAIRLSWESLIDDGARQAGSVWDCWRSQWARHGETVNTEATRFRLVWLRAHERSYQRALTQALQAPVAESGPAEPKVQAAFCIDVRSEVFRRHLEARSDSIQTLGFAGFFGLPIRYSPLGTEASRPQLPGLLAPAMTVSDTTGEAAQDEALAGQRQQALQRQAGWQPFATLPASAFSLVETLGLGYLGKLIKRSRPQNKTTRDASPGLAASRACTLRPVLQGSVEQRVTVAHSALTGMGLTGELAPLVLLVGHGSQNQNNPHRAGLDCGACCGQTGEVNARALADILNDEAVRAGLVGQGIRLPARTRFLAALHNTTTDEVTLFDTDSLQGEARQALPALQQALDDAGCAARAERAPALGLSARPAEPEVLRRQFRERANDWAQTRPEWGLANNAAFIVASRARTRGRDLGGRAFLHEYDSAADPNASLLTQIMTAPMVVTNWINMQYFASTVDNPRYGSGNKTLHNVVGGRLGVFEGNGGDLRIGLALQSVHDGRHWHHEPLRLTVVIDAPAAAIESVLQAQPVVRALVENQWLHLARFDGDDIVFYQRGQWQAPAAH